MTIAERRLELEERRVVAEEKRLRQEVKWGWITRLGVAVPLVVLVATLIYNGWEFSRAADADRDRERGQAAQESQRQIDQANIDAQLAIMGIMLNQESPQQAYAAALAFDDLGISEDAGGQRLAPLVEKTLDTDAGSKQSFIDLLVAHPGEEAEIIALWRELFPTDDWVNDLR
jgi:hypothetical protein